MRSEVFGLLALESTNVVMKLEKELTELGYKLRVIPVPKEVTANCGLSIKFDLEDLDGIKTYTGENHIRCEYYRIKKEGLKKEVEEI